METVFSSQEFLNALVQAVIVALGGLTSVLLTYAIRWTKAKIAELKAETPYLNELVNVVVPIAVQAAEQLGYGKKIEDKFEYAFEVAQHFLVERGFDVSTEFLEAAIEAAVLSEFNWHIGVSGLEGEAPSSGQPE